MAGLLNGGDTPYNIVGIIFEFCYALHCTYKYTLAMGLSRQRLSKVGFWVRYRAPRVRTLRQSKFAPEAFHGKGCTFWAILRMVFLAGWASQVTTYQLV